MDIYIFWFLLMGILLIGYAILDGFDLGVGMLHLSAKTDKERRIFMNSIGPLWDGNEVWPVTFGGALFAAFPEVYATAFSAFYLPFMFLLFCLIFRAVSMEFRSKMDSTIWRSFWDGAFMVSSTVAALLFGVAVGNVIQGMPIGADKEFAGTLMGLLNPYALTVGLMTVATFALHGSIFLYLKTEGQLQSKIKMWMWRNFGFFLIMYMLVTIFTLVTNPDVTDQFRSNPWGWLIVVLNVLAVANIPRAIFQEKPFYAFMSSCATIAALIFLFGAAIFPNMIPSSLNPDWSLTIYNSASSVKTLKIMRLIAFIGMPFVLAYTSAIYWVFRGKVKLGQFSY